MPARPSRSGSAHPLPARPPSRRQPPVHSLLHRQQAGLQEVFDGPVQNVTSEQGGAGKLFQPADQSLPLDGVLTIRIASVIFRQNGALDLDAQSTDLGPQTAARDAE